MDPSLRAHFAWSCSSCRCSLDLRFCPPSPWPPSPSSGSASRVDLSSETIADRMAVEQIILRARARFGWPWKRG
eukprot:6668925-Prymnesium_polylepis.1